MGNPTVSNPRADRRLHARRAPESLLYIHMDEGNGGLIWNISEGGLAICTALAVPHDVIPDLRFELPVSRETIAVPGQVAWKAESQKTLGIRFLTLPEAAQQEIQQWIQADPQRQRPSDGGSSKRVDWMSPVPPSSSGSEPRPASSSRAAWSRLAAGPTPAKGPAAAPAQPGAGPTLSLGLDTWRNPPPAPPTPLEEERGPSRLRLVVLFCVLIVLSLFLGFTSEGGFIGAGKALWQAGEQAWQALATMWSNEEPRVYDKLVPPPPSPAPPPASTSVGEQPLPPPNEPLSGAAAPRAGSQPAVSDRAPSEPVGRAHAGESATGKSHAGADSPRAGEAFTGKVSVLSHLHAIRVPQELQSSNMIRHNGLRLGEPLSQPPPAYPPEALRDGVEGTVKLRAVIGRDGSVASVQVEEGPAMLAEPSLAAVRRWRYQSARMGSHTVEWEEDVTLVFHLQNSYDRRR